MTSMQDLRPSERKPRFTLPGLRNPWRTVGRSESKKGTSIFASSSSVRTDKGIQDVEEDPLKELSFVQTVSKNGVNTMYLRVYCEKVRAGDHFKTLKVYMNTTAGKCVKDLVEAHFSKIGDPNDFELYEVIGSIEQVSKPLLDTEETLLFTEVRSRCIGLNETVQDIFGNSCAGIGLSRRIELRRRRVIPQRRGSMDVVRQNSLSFKRRANTPNLPIPNFRDSRSRRASASIVPNGPHLILLRGNQSVHDALLHSLIPLIEKDGLKSEFTIGSTATADIRIYDAPGEETSHKIFAKLVGYDYPLTGDVRGAIFLEPFNLEWAHTAGTQSVDIPLMYVNEELLNPSGNPFFRKKLLHPGDFIYFGSVRRGYIYLFKDPRWIPDHELQLSLNGPAGKGKLTNSNNQQKCHRNGSVASSDTDSSYQRVEKSPLRSDATYVALFPRKCHLRQVLSLLFIEPLSSPDSEDTSPFSVLHWSTIEPWRSAGLLAHLVRSAASMSMNPNPPIPNEDIEQRTPQIIQEYMKRSIDDMVSTVSELYQLVHVRGQNLIVPHLWLALFCYDLAIYLSPGWLTTKVEKSPRRHSAPNEELDSSGSSSNSNVDTLAPESVSVVANMRNLSYELADEALGKAVTLASVEIAPCLSTFYERVSDSDYSPSVGPSAERQQVSEMLNEMLSCFNAAFFPSGEDDRRGSCGSSPFYSTGSSNYSQQNSGSLRQSRRGRFYTTPIDFENPNWDSPMGAESDTGMQQSGTWSRAHSGLTREESELNTSYSVGTTGRVEAVVWRQLLAFLSHHILHTMIVKKNIQIDWNTGVHLMSGVEWLQEWLRAHRLEANRRPLTMITQFANLLSTPKEQLYKMTWPDMRAMYPEIPPSLLRFLLDDYEGGIGFENADDWHIEPQDGTAANENTLDVVDMILNNWRSKESLRYSKVQCRPELPYKPRDLHSLFGMPATGTFVRNMDQQLQAQGVEFRWADLLRHFPGPRAIDNDRAAFSSPHSRHRPPKGKRSIPNGNRRAMTGLPEGSVSEPKLNDNVFATGELPESLKPSPSTGEPTRIVRTYGDGNQQPMAGRSYAPQNNPNDELLYHLKNLATSLSRIDFSKFGNGEPTQPSNNLQDRLPRPNNGLRSNMVYESQPNLNMLHKRLKLTPGDQPYRDLPASPSSVSPNSFYTEYGQNRLPIQRLENNRLAQSMWQLPTDINRRQMDPSFHRTYGNKLTQASQDWEEFKQSMLGRGLDKIRTPVPSTSALNELDPMRSQVSGSLSQMNASTSYLPYATPKVIVEEANDGSSTTDSFTGGTGRDDDLSNTLSRTFQLNTVANVTLDRRQDTGYGLVLVDGERTSLDQPGVFVKAISPNSPAEENNEIAIGDRILAINGQDLTGMTYKDALTLLKNCKTQATFTIRRGSLSDPSLLFTRKGT
ncbi:unnamed protein product [Calicophoron daubneyi]|uniref:Ras-associating and dilute domain-containing protein n=1 Tax=Calicophoron daubneyi TaxID=300641 RepID=A0AAV2TU22_CALDB